MSTERKTSIIVGVLYLIGIPASGFAVLLTARMLDGPDYLIKIASHTGQVKWAAALFFTTAIGLPIISILMFSIIKKRNEPFAIGYLVFRGAFEPLTYVALALIWLMLTVAATQSLESGGVDSANFQNLGTLLVQARDPVLAIQEMVSCLGSLMFYYITYQTRLIPRWISVWGMIAFTGYVLPGVFSAFNPHVSVWVMSIALQETVMALWLIVKGFNPVVIESDHDQRLATSAI